MKKFIVSVRDSAAQVFVNPFVVPTIGIAERSFRDEVNRVDPQNMLNKHPEDFELWLIGRWDEDTGTFEAIEHQSIARGKEVVASSKDENQLPLIN